MEEIIHEKPNGRPPRDLKKLAKELVEWSYQSDALNLAGFSSPRRFSVTRLPDYASIDEEFSEALVLAKENIGLNRFKAACNDIMPQVFYTRCEGMYDPLYHEYERKEKAYDASLKKEEESNKKTVINLVVPDGLATGLNLSSKELSKKDNSSS
jgi:hypothetical protein